MKTEMKIVRDDDRNRGLITAAVFTAVMFILLIFLSVSQPDPPIKDIPVVIELTPEMIIQPSSSSSAGGAPNSGSLDPNPTPPDAGDPVLSTTKPKPVRHNTGQGGAAPVANPNPPQQQSDPTFTFGGGGSGGTGGSGTGTDFGSGTGGDGPDGNGTGTGGSRKILKKPCEPQRTADEGKVVLLVQIDESGRVIRADNVSSKSTTSSVSAIDAARRSVLDCMRYEARAGAPIYKDEVTIIVRSN